MDAVLGPESAGGVGDALAVQGAGNIQDALAGFGQAEDALHDGRRIGVGFQAGPLLGPVLDVDLPVAIGNAAGDPEASRCRLARSSQNFLRKIFAVEFVQGLNDGLHQLAGGGVVGVLGDGDDADALAPEHGLEGHGVLALAGEAREFPDQYLLEGSLRPGSLVQHLPELGPIGDAAALGLVHVFACDGVAVLLGIVPERPELGGHG